MASVASFIDRTVFPADANWPNRAAPLSPAISMLEYRGRCTIFQDNLLYGRCVSQSRQGWRKQAYSPLFLPIFPNEKRRVEKQEKSIDTARILFLLLSLSLSQSFEYIIFSFSDLSTLNLFPLFFLSTALDTKFSPQLFSRSCKKKN